MMLGGNFLINSFLAIEIIINFLNKMFYVNEDID